MHIRCPHCSGAIEIVESTSFRGVTCSACGSHFNLVGSDTATESYQVNARQIAQFELIEQVGIGQFGSVWKAQDTRLQRTVAVKIPRKDQLSPPDEELFFRDARAAAQLNHPNIVAVHEVGREGGTIYIAMDYVEGADLKEWLRDQPVPPREAAKIMISIARAVHHAHQNGIIHRDLKPANIMIGRDRQPYITDFGLAKRECGEITMTIDGVTLGTPAYMSPEQASGRSHDADRTSDVYSLGVILYEMLTGTRPFHGEKRMLLLQIIEDEPPSIRRINNTIPADVETICLKCLRKEPTDRYQSAEELAADLQRWLQGDPINARPIGRLAKSWHWVRKRPAFIGSLATAFVIAAIATTAIYVQRYENDRRRAESLTRALLAAPAEAVPFAIQSVHTLRRHAMRHLRRHAMDDTLDERGRLHAFYALAQFGDPSLDWRIPVAAITDAPSGECDNIVAAAATNPDVALPLLMQAAAAAESKEDWKLKARLAIVLLHLGEDSIAADMLQVQDRPDPAQRTIFIERFSTWHGDLANLARVLQKCPDGSLISGMCLAVSTVLENNPSVANAWRAVLTTWHRTHPDRGVHSASACALQKMGILVPHFASGDQKPQGAQWEVTEQGLTMIRIPAGTFTRSTDEGERNVDSQIVALSEFLLSDREVTVNLFRRFVDATDYPGEKPSGWEGHAATVSPSGDHPIQQVSWNDAAMFCNWLSWREGFRPYYRLKYQRANSQEQLSEGIDFVPIPAANGYFLPSEAQWEYACRSGTTTLYSSADDAGKLEPYAVVLTQRASAVSGQMCNRWGLFDMHGNVSEWCGDWYAPYGSSDRLLDPLGPMHGTTRVVRGGSWNVADRYCTSAYRDWLHPWIRSNSVGFRVARTGDNTSIQTVVPTVAEETGLPWAVMFVLDCSAGMSRMSSDGKNHFDMARQGLLEVFHNVQADQHRLGLTAFGHRAGHSRQNSIVYRSNRVFPHLAGDSSLYPGEDVQILRGLVAADSSPSIAELQRMLQSLEPWGESPLYLAIRESAETELLGQEGKFRRRLVVITNGANEQSHHAADVTNTRDAFVSRKDLDPLLDRLRTENISIDILFIGFEQDWENNKRIQELKEIANVTGGKLVYIHSLSRLRDELNWMLFLK